MTARRGGVPDYAGAHRRLRSVRGPATDQRCAECGAPARCWCYDGSDPDERRDPASGRRYSLDPGRYRARCASCHRAVAAGHEPLAPEVVEHAAALYEAGASLDHVAAAVRVTRPTLRTALAAHGVVLRDRAGAVDVAQAVALYEAGASVRQVAARLGAPRAIVRAALAARGVVIRERTAPIDAARAARLYEAGASLRGIALQLHAPAGAVRAALVAHGVAIRPPGPTRRHLRLAVTRADDGRPSEQSAVSTAQNRRPRITFRPFPMTSRQPSTPSDLP